jgi:hypothetical protein
MARIIDRQQEIIKSLRQHNTYRESISLSGHNDGISDDEDYQTLRSHSDLVTVQPPPMEQSFIPPWDVDMDDIRRQLQDLDDNVYRVGMLKDRLSGAVMGSAKPRLRNESG